MGKKIQTLPGFRDFYPEDCSARNYLFDRWRAVARRYGFVEYEAPLLEPTALYQKKSGAGIVNQLFCFTDKGERQVSMRPELTPSLARMVASRHRDFKKPLRWFSIGEFFRYEKHQRGRGREFYQFNCDILGEESPAADAELAALAIDIMRELGFGPHDFRLRISDRQAWCNYAAEKGVPEDQLGEFLSVIDKKDRTKPEDLERALKKFDLDPGDIDEFIGSGGDASPALQSVVEDLRGRDMSEYVEVDLGIVRGLAYYTGTVFEIFDIGQGMRAVAGGGRYDQLLGLIGGVEMPACGFAMGDMVITDLVRASERPAELMEAAMERSRSVDVYVIVADETRRGAALRVVQELRDAGFRSAYPYAPQKVGRQFQAAEQIGAKFAAVIGKEFPDVTLKDLANRSEETCAVEDLGEKLAQGFNS